MTEYLAIRFIFKVQIGFDSGGTKWRQDKCGTLDLSYSFSKYFREIRVVCTKFIGSTNTYKREVNQLTWRV